jgi:hypothetical protein
MPPSVPEPSPNSHENETKILGLNLLRLAVMLWIIGYSVLTVEWLPAALRDGIQIGMNLMWPFAFLGGIVWLAGCFREENP